MPDNADMEGGLKARYEDGVLEITVPKKKAVEGQERAAPKAIAVE